MAQERERFNREGNRLSNPLEGGRIVLGITTQDRQSAATSREAPPPSQRDIDSSNSLQASLETVIADKVRQNRFLKAGMAALGVGTAIYVAYNEWPGAKSAVHERIDSFRNTFNSNDGPQLTPRTESNSNGNQVDFESSTNHVFDNATEKGIITRGNTVELCQDEIDTLPTEDENGNPLYLFPVSVMENTKYVRDETIIVGLSDVRAGTPIVAGRDGYAFSWRTTIAGPDGKAIFASDGTTTGIRVVSKDNNGRVRLLNVDTSRNMSDPDAKLKANTDIPYLGLENSSGRDYTKGLPVQKGDILGYTNEDIQYLQVQEWTKNLDGDQIYIGPDEKQILNPPNFNTQVDDLGNTKIVIRSCTQTDQIQASKAQR